MPPGKNNFWQKYSAFPVNLTPLSRNNFVLWVESLYIIFQGWGFEPPTRSASALVSHLGGQQFNPRPYVGKLAVAY